jgi:hypothetical protein
MPRSNYPTTDEVMSKTGQAPTGPGAGAPTPMARPQGGMPPPPPGAMPGLTPDAAAPLLEALQAVGAFIAALVQNGSPKAKEAMDAFRKLIAAIRPEGTDKGTGSKAEEKPGESEKGSPKGEKEQKGARPMSGAPKGARPMGQTGSASLPSGGNQMAQVQQ